MQASDYGLSIVLFSIYLSYHLEKRLNKGVSFLIRRGDP